MIKYGVSFSVKQCRNFGIDSQDCLKWLIKDCGFRRFRLMSYWDEIEKSPGIYDFSELDWQIEMIQKVECEVSLCLGARQPRWPETHYPVWALKLSQKEREAKLNEFVEKTVKRYKKHSCITSYQLENEAYNIHFGENGEVNRRRLRCEFRLVKKLDKKRPVIMTTTNSWGIPLLGPIPDIVGFSFYQKQFNERRQKYITAYHRPFLFSFRAWLIKLIWRRPCFIHELQLEPWGPKAIWEMSWAEQLQAMSPEQITTNLKLAQKTGLQTIDLWGAEWWYWCTKKQNKPEIIDQVLSSIK